jgi:hypothetical protein
MRRLDSSLPLARKPATWPSLFGIATIGGLVIVGPGKMLTGGVLVVFFGCSVLAALVGPIPPQSGRWLVGVIRRFERRVGRIESRLVAGLITALAVAAVPLLDWLPHAVADAWPRVRPPVTAADSGALGALWLFRNGLYARDYAAACAHVRIPAQRERVPCLSWAPLVAALQNGDPLDQRGGPVGHVFGLAPPGKFLLDYEGSYNGGLGLWYIRPRDAPSRYTGVMEAEVPSGTLVEIFLTRESPVTSIEQTTQHAWFYEAQLLGQHFFVTRVDDCAGTTPGSGEGPVTNCGFRDSISQAELARFLTILREKGYLNRPR